MGKPTYPWSAGLSSRAALSLFAAGFNSKEQICQMVKTEGLPVIRNVGEKTRDEIYKWCGVERKKEIIRRCECCGQVIKENKKAK